MDRIYLLHGFMGTSQSHFLHQITAWHDIFTVIPIDLPGHGSNPLDGTRPYFSSTLSWLMDLIEDQGRGHLVGLSLGASLAIHVALNNPGLCQTLVLSGYSPFIPEELEPLMRQQYEQFQRIEQEQPQIVQEFLTLHGTRWKNTLMAVLDDMTFHYPRVDDHALRTLSVPTLVLNGSQESYERHAAVHVADIGNPLLQVGLIPGAGHVANRQKPDVYNTMVLDFWAGLSVTDKPVSPS
ncbi:alpha/beta fold hydrolase [Sulfobacillus thermosulfidooxidans]|uniref:alpha/beta fold hydrolase n=1 Tax=Sulfobacillus thermosulfidooxidans TaxID=28034 RepID=UPI0006B47E45|nr:alpha/beta fold hydrolase [Sulfobacillus thermosulfidooxidans]